MEEQKRNIDIEITDAIMERPHGFKIAGQWFYLYPPTLGKAILLGRLIPQLELNGKRLKIVPAAEILRVVSEHKDIVCTILAYHTAKNKDEIFSIEFITEREQFLKKNLSSADMVELLLIVLANDPTEEFIKHIGIDKERKQQSRISKLKNEKGNTVSFGGNSMYGSLLDAACERYGWTLDYVVWGISYVNLRMMMSDAINSVYLTDEERKKVRISTDKTRIKMDEKGAWDKIKSMKWD